MTCVLNFFILNLNFYLLYCGICHTFAVEVALY